MGIVTRGDLLLDEADDDEPVLAHASCEVVGVRPDDLAATALRRMVEESVEHLPVLGGGMLVGICTRTDLMRIRGRQFELERHQDGWRPRSPLARRGRAAPEDAPSPAGGGR